MRYDLRPRKCQRPETRSSAPQLHKTGSFRLLCLPIELRRMIYTYSLTFSPLPGKLELEGRRSYEPNDKNYGSLLLVNRQIYLEARELPFQINLFRIEFGNLGLDTSSYLLSRLTSWQAEQVQNVEIMFSGLEMELPFRLERSPDLRGCKYFEMLFEGKLDKQMKLDKLPKTFELQSNLPKSEHVTITAGSILSIHLFKDLWKAVKEKLPKLKVVVLREGEWLAMWT